MRTTLNQYFVCLGNRKEPIAWNPYDANQKINLHTDYFGKAFVAMEEELQAGGWTVYLTWSLRKLPSYGDKVVAVVLGDEWGRIPSYAARVGIIFKCYGIRPQLGCRPFTNPSYQNWLTFLQYLNAGVRFIPGWVHRKWSINRHAGALPPIYTIPLGYANQQELPLKPFGEREFDVSFAGSVVHKPYKLWSLKHWFQTPKSYSRRHMISEMKRIQQHYPDWKFDLKITESYKAIRTADPVEYSERVMNTKISVAPRGTSYETFRFFEALRFGCIVITEFLPSGWFYDEAPVIRISDWSQLEDKLQILLKSPNKLDEMHHAALGWWNNVCSESALGTFMASKLKSTSKAVIPAL